MAARNAPVVAAVGAWFVLALLVGASGRLLVLRPPAPQLILLGLTAALLVAGRCIPGLRAWVLTVDLRILVGLHVSRFLAGAYFLVLYRRGELPYAFAVPGGLGDMLVAILAVGLLLSGGPSSAGRRRAYGVWNGLGLLDILFVVATAARVWIADPESMRALLILPLSVLPTFLVPLIIASHVAIAARLWRTPAMARARGA